MNHKKYNGKSILIGIPDHFELPQRFKENLEHIGFKVFDLINPADVSIPLKDKIIHGVKKSLFNDKTHKVKVRNNLKSDKQLLLIEGLDKVDYALFIRPDLYSFKVIEKVKKIAEKTVAYQWDGMKRYPLAEKYISLFDHFYVFDKEDLKMDTSLKLIQNFYFDDLSLPKKIQHKSVFFIGTFMKNRIKRLEKIADALISRGLSPHFLLYKEKKESFSSKFDIIQKKLSFKENLLNVLKSEYVLDLQNDVHNGLSFRVFESVGFQKKLITDNTLVKEYDFYNPNNIYIIENDNFSGLDNFIRSPYEKINEEIRLKYSFTNWIEKILMS